MLITFATSLFATPAQVIIIPQAEIDASGNLTQKGLERAGALAPYITQTPLLTQFGEPASIFAARPTVTVPTQACIQTVGPTGQMLSLPIHSGYSDLQNTTIASLILNNPNYNGKNILICWRNASIQGLAAALGVPSPPVFPSNVYNLTWLITFSPTAKLQILPQDLLTCGNCGTIPYPTTTGYVTPDPILNSPQVWSFVSEPDLHPMKVTVNTPGTTPGSIFLAPYAFSAGATYGQSGSLIQDNAANPIWFSPLSSPNLMNTDFRKQMLNGSPVLTFWQGSLVSPPAYTNAPGGSSEPGSCYYILDNSYRVITTITAQNGFTSDIHEFLITPNNTALFLSTMAVPMDLTPYGGPQNGFVQDFAIQEVDIQTNQLLFFWDALQHLSLSDSFEPASSATSSGNIWDAFHCNSIGITDVDTDIILSSRNFWTIFRINKPTGNIVWRLGGKQSSFTFGSGAQFSWQHDARFFPNTATSNIITLFDDNCCESTIPPGTPPAHGLILFLDLTAKTASVNTTYFHNPLLQVSSQGNVQTLTGGNKFVGWGQSQYFSMYAAPGNTISTPSVNLLYDAQMPGNNYTYRAYCDTWVGTPFYPPKMAVNSTGGQVTVYASWNGSTETATWDVYAGTSPSSLSLVTSASLSGFETAIPVSNNGPYFQVKALDNTSTVIGVSSVVQLSN